MSEVKAELLYSEDHEWAAEAESGTVRVGITDFAQRELGDIVFVELPGVGAVVEAGGSLGTIESVKTVSDLYAPVSGRVVKVNEALLERPEQVNEDPYGAGWVVELAIEGTLKQAGAHLLTAEGYLAHIDSLNE
ncbi:glycine cleavage system protein GcvH [Paenibacillus mucilaginosus]|uniref:Glycine cleavage system H protein n=2 Tax=Paenibacillus mucilaginosus TaxID=61624 RepID=I0BU24_9BACL|nr:glycine cleavage system protein GcvH [Paenibacillus mucilaginosus]AEI45904.1 GcvH2 [Paenibacillus mucilaginosus KNP414]AFH65871.1 glycine cleavage system protein H [Paenibacillus mucilaginosus K02]MCG7216769.1 glycine cleavage system protein GcvH [Paenibacillus mucilaginosus]WDM27263.1 glycine cleavage system protein GcvH [Paenibacillus mucilaginosus]